MVKQGRNIKRIVIKVGTNVLTTHDGELDTAVIASVVEQISDLKKQGVSVILVSSGAVGAGKSVYQLQHTSDEAISKQVYSAIGQVKLMNLYSDLFAQHNLHCAQVLATKEDFLGKEHYTNMKNCFEGLLADDIIPIVNENDVVSLKELMFTDNDELAGLTAFLIQADTLFLLTNVDGMYDGNPKAEGTSLISNVIIGENDQEVESYIHEEKSSAGRGGMQSKFNTAIRCAEKGIVTYMANGKSAGVIDALLTGTGRGTKFVLEA